MRGLIRFISIAGVFLAASAVAQETSKNNYSGSWRVNSSWNDNSFPSNTAVSGGDFNIYGYITLGTSGARQNLTISNNTDAYDFIVRDTLVVFGDVDFPNNGMDLVISSGALFIVFGNFTLGNQMDVATTGNLIVTGTFTKSGSAGQGSYTGGGNTYAGSFSIPGSWVPAADQKNTGSNLQADLQNVYNFVQGGGSGSLPVELTTFEVTADKGICTLTWSTASQLNFSHFEVEHSYNAVDWFIETTMAGEGNTQELLTYSFTDGFPMQGNNYYRLKMVDLDETFEYSPVKKVVVTNKKEILVSPNPTATKSITYSLNFVPSSNGTLRLYDVTGVELMSMQVEDFSKEITLPTSLIQGTYFVRYTDNQITLVTRLLVR